MGRHTHTQRDVCINCVYSVWVGVCRMIHTQGCVFPSAVYIPSELMALGLGLSLKERLSTAVFVRGREVVSAWGPPACPAWACPTPDQALLFRLRTAGTPALNRRPIYPSHTPPAK